MITSTKATTHKMNISLLKSVLIIMMADITIQLECPRGCTCDVNESNIYQFDNILCGWGSFSARGDTTSIAATTKLSMHCDSKPLINAVQFTLHHLQNKSVLKEVEFTFCPVPILTNRSIPFLPNLRILNITNSDLNSITDNALQNLPSLSVINLTNNKLSVIPDTIPGHSHNTTVASKIQELYLDGNSLQNICNQTFKEFTNLKVLTMAMTGQHETLPEGLFMNLHHLKTLDLSRNTIPHISPTLFDNTTDLEVLLLYSNALQVISTGTFNNLRKLRILDLSLNIIHTLSVDVFNGMESLQHLNLRYNMFLDLPSNLFHGLHNLQHIDLSEIEFSWSRVVLPDDLFIDIPMLKTLDISKANITSLRNMTFAGSVALEEINFSTNHIKLIPKDAVLFSHAINLRTVDFSYNEISSIESHAFQDSQLRSIDLSHNNITIIQKHTFYKLSQLNTLDLSHNYIYFIHAVGLFQLPNLKELRLNNNLLTNFQFFLYARRGALVQPLPALPDFLHFDDPMLVYMANNPFNCDCQMFAKLFNTSGHARYEHILWPGTDQLINQRFMPDPSSLVCYRPMRLRGRSIMSLKKNEYWCETTSFCPDNCTCYMVPVENSLIVNCSYRGFTEIPDNLWFGISYLLLEGNYITRITNNKLNHFTRLWELYLNNNAIQIIDDKAFHNLTSLITLDLSYNLITKITNEFTTMSNLENLYLNFNNIDYISTNSFVSGGRLKELMLDNNMLESIDVDMFNNTNSLTMLTLHNNLYQCDCQTPWVDFKHWLQQPSINAIVAFQYNITCSTNNTLEDVPILQANENDLNCTTSTDSQVINVIQNRIIGAVLGLAVIAMIIGVTVFKFRNIIRVIIYNRTGWRLHHNKDYEDAKIYDAFLSFSSEDLPWVKNSLLKKLENHVPPYKICIHHRDFIIGECIATNILDAVEKSRRIIVILSNNFLRSEWCAYEFNQAHLQVVRDKSCRLIVILMEKIPQQDIDKEIKMYLKTNTYLEMNDPMFWEKLYYVMPDVHGRKDENADEEQLVENI